MSRLSLFLFGTPRIELDGEAVKLNNRKATALLAYIALSGSSQSRNTLVNLLWPDYDNSRGRTTLRSTMYVLSGPLKGDWLISDREIIAPNPDADLWVDVNWFRTLLAQCRTHGHPLSEVCSDCLSPLTDAVELYQGDFMAGFSLKDSVNFDDWQVAQAQNLHSEMTGALERLVRHLSEGGEPEKAIGYAQRWLEMEKTNEGTHRQLMELYAKTGDRTAALEQYEQCVKILKEKLRISPQESTVKLYEAIKENRLQVVEPPAAKSLQSAGNNLPLQLTSFIGREAEIAEIQDLLTTTRLLTLTGAGGCGKTRLALEVASDLVDEYTNGAWFVELASLSDPDLVPQEVASTLDVLEQAGRSFMESLSNYLRAKEILLVLDNCEHLIEACATLSQGLLQVGPNLRILATSREPLGITGETTWEVPPLSVPDSSLLPSLQTSDLTKYEALRLFTDRAAIILPTFEMTDRIAPTVARICYRLDGIPLAIELAAARVKTLSADQLVERLDDRFGLLTGGSRTALPRQQTLRATVDWSHELLSAAERTLFRRLSVFAGGFTLRGAEAVCNGAGDPSAASGQALEIDVLDGITSLMDKSLLRGEEASHKWEVDEPRFLMLETIREYGLERLAQSGEEEEIRRHHANFFLALAEEGEEGLRGPKQVEWLERLELQYDDLRRALEWSMESRGEHGSLSDLSESPNSRSPRAELGLRLAGALTFFWNMSGYWSEGRGWLERVLSRRGGASASSQVKALTGAGFFATIQLDYDRAVELSEESLSLSKELGSREGIGWSLGLLGAGKVGQGDFSEGRRLMEESLALARESEDKWIIAGSLIQPGMLALHAGDYDRARELVEESLALYRELGGKLNIIFLLSLLGRVASFQEDNDRAMELFEESLNLAREIGDKMNTANSLLPLGRMALNQGDYDRAKALLEECSTLAREMEDKQILTATIRVLGSLAFAQGDYEKAIALYKESLPLSQEVNDRGGIAGCLEGLAEVVGSQGRMELAARLYGAAEAWRETAHVPLHPSFRTDYDRSVSAVRAGMDEETFAAEWAEGRAMSLEDAVEYALTIEKD